MSGMARKLVILGALPALAACEALFTEPAPAFPTVQVSFSLHGSATGSGVTRAFAKVDRVHLRFVRPDSASRDTIVRITARDGVARARLAVAVNERISALGVYATLAAGAAPVFEGGKVIRVQVGTPTSVEIPVASVPSRLRADRSGLTLQVGDTTRLSSAVLFATGDTIPGVVGSWLSEDPAVVFVTQGGLVAARAPGQVRLLVKYRHLADTVTVRAVRR